MGEGGCGGWAAEILRKEREGEKRRFKRDLSALGPLGAEANRYVHVYICILGSVACNFVVCVRTVEKMDVPGPSFFIARKALSFSALADHLLAMAEMINCVFSVGTGHHYIQIAA